MRTLNYAGCGLGCFTLIILLGVTSGVAQQRNPALAPIEADPALPNVLLIGDSISIGYTLPVRELLDGVANVHRIPTNGGPTTRGLEQLHEWLGDRDWDVIHFNWGLHDLKFIDDNGRLVSPDSGHQQVPPDDYRTNLTQLVERLQESGATLIWCSTTPVPDGAAGRIARSEEQYNDIAAAIMKAHDIAINDLCGFAASRLEDIQRPANVHFTPEGSRVLAEEVVEHLRRTLTDGP